MMFSHKLVHCLIGLVLLVWCSSYAVVECGNEATNYGDALSKSLLFFEAQRSGRLPANQRSKWRGHSALRDGQGVRKDLVGGYYDAGDNVKFNFPMAYTITMLAWGAIEFKTQFDASHESQNILVAIRWGTDYLLKSHAADHILFAGVGDGDADHSCWERPEDMDTPRTPYVIDESHPGSDLAAETAAAMAAASIVFKASDSGYSSTLLAHAKTLFDFAESHKGLYSNSVTAAQKFYSSSAFEDEQLWAAAWLHRATNDDKYKDFLANSPGTGGPRTMFSWDDKYVGAQILATKYVLKGDEEKQGNWAGYQDQAEEFLCNFIQKGKNNFVMTPGGLVWFNEWSTLQYSSSSLLALTVYAGYLKETGNSLSCPNEIMEPNELIEFAKSQVDYILGKNPSGMSYMVGYGSKFPVEVHHRGASIVSIKRDKSTVGCKDGFTKWFDSAQPNPNVLVGALVGGPGSSDEYGDDRNNYKQAEPATATVAPFVGVLARLSS